MADKPSIPAPRKTSVGGQNPGTQSAAGQARQGSGDPSSSSVSGEKRPFGGVRGGDERNGETSQRRAPGDSTEMIRLLDAIEENCTKLRAALRGRDDGTDERAESPRRGASDAPGKKNAESGRDGATAC